MLNMLATLAEYERGLIVERINAGLAASKQNGTRFGYPAVNSEVVADKLAIATTHEPQDGPPKKQHVSSAGTARPSTGTNRP